MTVTYPRCSPAAKDVRPTAGGEPKAQISFTAYRIIGWYDDQHIAAWRKRGSGYQAVVIDFKGRVKRVFATTTDATKHRKQFLSFTRTASAGEHCSMPSGVTRGSA
ncbi:hypothetical protein FHS43_000506 [Streptosporangium becharense]|uniref:Uncharacterized protein n=1 Tax=Streptosporangium becharense TaxID=1816182 RepID=A0A7W9IFQ8_9ACTN|nr:hypothetical protein [Streptosporangium becharense]MBB2909260.1 hypothetical protein [Streptosporangium becharense]MBB5819721.1 hypothetical protein [Streptosporangium becharense]